MRVIFVFGSNRAGRHGAGAALHALRYWGAIYWKGEGLHGDSYAIPTKDKDIQTLPLSSIEEHVNTFIVFAASHPSLQFLVTRIGCGLAGYTDAEIAPMFRNAPPNCRFDAAWERFLK